MTHQSLPKSYEEILANPDLKTFAQEAGWLKETQAIAVIPDENNTPVIYQPGQKPKTPCDWQEGTPVTHLLGETTKETEEILSHLEFQTYHL